MSDIKTEMTLNEALVTTEEILRIIAIPQNHFAENMREYICNRLDISEESLVDVLNTIFKEAKQ